MKKILALILAAIMLLSVVACTNDGENETNVPGESDTVENEAPAASVDALEVLTSLWNSIPDDNKFSVMGGSPMNPVDGMPGEFSLTDEGAAESLDGMTHYPAAQFNKLTGAATLMHMMNANTFTAAAYTFADAATADAMVSAIKDAILAT